MAKTKLSLCVFLFTCCVFVLVFGSSDLDQLENINLKPNLNPSEDLSCSFKCEDFKALETRNREQGKVIEELKEQFKSLSKKFDGLESKISEDEDLSMLRPPLRGPPGKQGEAGEKGQRGEIGLQGRKGESGRHGEAGQKGDRGDRGLIAPQSIASCSDALEILPSPRSKKQKIYPHGNRASLEVLCDFETDGGGWTVIQKRSSGPELDFNGNWTAYVNGFQTPTGNLWLGLDNIHALTKDGDQELRIDLEDFEGNKRYAKYSSFLISDGSDFYRLSVSGYYGDSTAGDSFLNPGASGWVNNGMRFSTTDEDNDRAGNGNCGEWYHSGWWFNHCGAESNLNGKYRVKGTVDLPSKGIIWATWKGDKYSLAKTEMKIRTRK